MQADIIILKDILEALKALDKPKVKDIKPLISKIEDHLNDEAYNAKRSLEEATFKAVKEYAEICIGLDDPNDPSGLYDYPEWRDQEAYLFLLGRHINKHQL